MTREAIADFLAAHRRAVVATASATGAPEAALVGYAVTDRMELVYDTSARSRKAENLAVNPAIAAVVGSGKRTLQYEGLADEPSGDDLERCKRAYFAAWPDGRERESWPDITDVRVRPRWARLTEYGTSPPSAIELDLAR